MKKTFLVICLWLLAGWALGVDGVIVNTVNYSLSDAWYKIPAEDVPVVVTRGSVFQDEYFILTVILKDYAIDAENNVKVTYDLVIKDPNGKVVFSQKAIPGFVRKVNDGGKAVLKTETDMKISFEKDKPLGKYTMEAVFHDMVSGQSSTAKASIDVVKYKYEKFFTDDDKFYEWMDNYYQQPSPEKILDGYIYFTSSKLNEKESAFVPYFTFFLKLFDSNKYLIPELQKMYDAQGLKSRIYFIWMLRYSGYDSSAFLKKLKGDEKKVYDQIKDTGYMADPYGELLNPSQLDALWGEFRAMGNYRPIQKVISALAYKDYVGAMNIYKNAKVQTEEMKLNAMREATYLAAVWSLGKKNGNKALVISYCVYAMANDDTVSKEAREELRSMLTMK